MLPNEEASASEKGWLGQSDLVTGDFLMVEQSGEPGQHEYQNWFDFDVTYHINLASAEFINIFLLRS